MAILDVDLNKMIEEFELVNPSLEVSAAGKPAPRLTDLNGKRACFLENTTPPARIVLARIKEVLEQRYQLADSRVVSKLWYSRPAAPELLDEIARTSDFVISGIGL